MNKLPWFTHDHDAHEDGWIRNLIRKQGHVAGWLWWVLCEQHHKHGVGDLLKRDINDVAKAGLTSNSVVVRVLTEMGTVFEGQTKVRWTLVGTELELEIPKLRKRQAKLKSKVPSILPQSSLNTPLYREEEGEGEKEREKRTIVPAGRMSDSERWFDIFWNQYPSYRRVKKAGAKKIWMKLNPDKILFGKILLALKAQKPEWLRNEPQFTPHPTSWLNGKCWDDSVLVSKTEAYLDEAKRKGDFWKARMASK